MSPLGVGIVVVVVEPGTVVRNELITVGEQDESAMTLARTVARRVVSFIVGAPMFELLNGDENTRARERINIDVCTIDSDGHFTSASSIVNDS